ncbi:MAG: pyridoxal phosphate-dependent aminotransferase family protein, partial [Nanoarchaeota archaeon]
MALHKKFQSLLQQEVRRIDAAGSSKLPEKVIDGYFFQHGRAPQGLHNGKRFLVFNSNDYLGMRFHPNLREAEEKAVQEFGTGPGAVRFISGTSRLHKELEQKLAWFHGREDCMLFSSAFSANLAIIHCLIKGQSKDSLVKDSTLVISDALNHRSIIDGIRVAGMAKENKAIFTHFGLEQLKSILEENRGKFQRVLVISDGVFSMLGEYQDLKRMREIVDAYQDAYEEGVLMVIDDCHGVATLGKTGRGTEEVCGAHADILIGTLGNGFGAEGGYCVADKVLIEYLRESAATYIYSNPISPGIAAAGVESITIL